MGTFTALPGVGRLRASILSSLISELRPIGSVMTVDQALATGTTTLANVSELVVPVASNTTYSGWLHLFYTNAVGTTEDIKVAFTFPSGAVLHFGGAGGVVGLTGTAGDIEAVGRLSATSGTTVISLGASTSTVQALIRLRLAVGSTSGSLQVQAAQNTSGANATTVKAGSSLEIRQVL